VQRDVAAKMPFHQSGTTGWVMVAAGVIAWDLLAQETMSSAVHRACSTPQGTVLFIAGWGILTAHLLAVLPEKADPLMILLKAVKAGRLRRH
jgi:hypothetical protein